MPGRRCQDPNIEKFVRQNASLIAKHAQENPHAARHMYKCKDCDKEYHSFQALGGHRASHRKLKTETGAGTSSETSSKAKLHECKICGKGFGIGQALGGHMRKHRDTRSFNNGDRNERIWSTAIVPYHPDSFSTSSSSSIASNLTAGKEVLEFDLNLTPHENLSMNGVRL